MRSTFRERATDKCYQRQLRDRFKHEGRPPGINLNLRDARIKKVSRKFAEQIILKYEWLGTMSTTSHHYGIFFGMRCGGVICIGTHATGGMVSHKLFELESSYQQSFLARGACVHWAPPGTNSKLIAWGTKLFARENPTIKIMVAYADTDAGEIGTVYQACNWIYIGKSARTMQYINPEGRFYENVILWHLCDKHKVKKPNGENDQKRMKEYLLQHGWKTQMSNAKHRYVIILDKKDNALRDVINKLTSPYPKRNRNAPLV